MTVLRSCYNPPTRPYSQKELAELHVKNLTGFGIGPTYVSHSRCKHSYYVKSGGRKERIIKESNKNVDVGNCSVCWKMQRTPPDLRSYANEIVDAYSDDRDYEAHHPNARLEHRSIELEKLFYAWLYQETY